MGKREGLSFVGLDGGYEWKVVDPTQGSARSARSRDLLEDE